jgi:hypothetical protein
MNKIFVPVLLLALLSGCASTKVQPPPQSDMVINDLLKAADQVHNEMEKMNVESGRVSAIPSASDFSGCSTKIVSIDFDGDLMLFVDDMMKANVCHVRMVGKKPKQDMILSLHHKKVPFWQVMEDAGVQLGNMAAISVSKTDVLVSFGR